MKVGSKDKAKKLKRFQQCVCLCLFLQVFHLEDIVEQTGYVLEKDSEYSQKILEEEEEVTISVTQKGGKTLQHQVMSAILTILSCPFMPHQDSETRVDCHCPVNYS